MYTGILITSRSLHMPIVPDGQVAPGGAAAGIDVGVDAAAVVAGAGSSAEPDDAGGPPVVAGAGTTDARNGSGLLALAGVATSEGLRAGTTGGGAGLSLAAVAGGAVDPWRAGRSRGMTSGGGDPATAGAGGGPPALGIRSCWPILIL